MTTTIPRKDYFATLSVHKYILHTQNFTNIDYHLNQTKQCSDKDLGSLKLYENKQLKWFLLRTKLSEIVDTWYKNQKNDQTPRHHN